MQGTHFNQLTPGEAERLAVLLEELGEAQQVVGKILRHGWAPNDNSVEPPKAYDNRADLERELGDVAAAVKRLTVLHDLSSRKIELRAQKKFQDVSRLHHQEQIVMTGGRVLELRGSPLPGAPERVAVRREVGP